MSIVNSGRPVFEVEPHKAKEIEEFLQPFMRAGALSSICNNKNNNFELIAQTRAVVADFLKPRIDFQARQALSGVTSGSTQSMMISGLPTGKILPTPSFDNRFKAGTPNMGEYINLGVSGIINKDMPVDAYDFADVIRTNSTKNPKLANLEPMHSHPEDQYVLLFCLRGNDNAKVSHLNSDLMYFENPNEIRELLKTPFLPNKNGDIFPIIEMKNDYTAQFSHDFAASVAPKILKEYIKNNEPNEFTKLSEYLLDKYKDRQHATLAYEPGDLIIYDQRTTSRFSDRYPEAENAADKRWLSALGVAPKGKEISISVDAESVNVESLLKNIYKANKIARDPRE